MTFSEDDLLPYKRLKYVGTPEYFKTIYMQWTMLDSALQGTGFGFVTGIHSATLSQMSVLDTSSSVSESHYHPQDFAARFDQVVNGTDADSQRRTARRKELLPTVYTLFNPQTPELVQLSAKVEKLIDEELKETTIPQASLITANVRSKARTLMSSSFMYPELLTSF
jgi:hypothetical protein